MSDHDASSPPSPPTLAATLAEDGVYWLDARGRIVWSNEPLRQLLGYGGEELAGLEPADLMADRNGDGELPVGGEVGEAVTFEARFRSKSGRTVPVEVTHLSLAQAGEARVAGIVRDLSERQRAEADLRAEKDEADRANAAKTRFLAAASHDLRQPLHAMELLVSALAGKDLGEEAQAIVSDMQDSLVFAGRLLNSLLDVSELEAGIITPHVEDVPLAPLLRRIHQQYLGIAREKGLDLRLVPSRAVVRSDPGLLERIFDNLVSNAVRYTDRGRVLIGCRRQGGIVRLEVWDTGPGIPESGQAAIFEDFCQLDSSAKERGAGLGLGLGLVRRLAELLDHPVRLRSTSGRGSLFWVELRPVERAPASEPLAGRPQGEGEETAGATVMIIEDDVMVQNAMRVVLEAWGYRVVAVASAEAARATDVIPDVVIADYRLPGGETGDQAVMALRQRAGRELPGVIVTGEVMPPAWADGLGADLHVMKKPVRPAKLRALIRNLSQA